MPVPIGFKHTELSKQKIRDSVLRSFSLHPEKHNYWQGRKQPDEMVKKRIAPLIGRTRTFSEVHKQRISLAQLGKPKINLRGERHGNWKGGIKTLTDQIRHSLNYRSWRTQVFNRDGFKCVLCGDKNYLGRGKTVKLEVDHFPVTFSSIIQREQIKSISQAEESKSLWDISNGRTLCVPCHNSTKPGRKKHD